MVREGVGGTRERVDVDFLGVGGSAVAESRVSESRVATEDRERFFRDKRDGRAKIEQERSSSSSRLSRNSWSTSSSSFRCLFFL